MKQIGLAYLIWAGDNGDILPMGISVTNGGSMEMVVAGNVVQTFLVMSNELYVPKLLICPVDVTRIAAFSFPGLSRSNISYFVGVDITNETGHQMLSGDSNFQIGGSPVKSGLLLISTNVSVAWTSDRHIKEGNIGFADGSVGIATTNYLQAALHRTGLATNRFAIP